MKSLCNQNNLNVEFLGQLEQVELTSYIRNSLCVVVPSIYHEPFGLVAIESLSKSKFVLAKKVGGIKDIIIDGYNGFLYNSENSLLNKIKYIHNNREKLNNLNINAFHSSYKYNSDNYYNNIMNVYQS